MASRKRKCPPFCFLSLSLSCSKAFLCATCFFLRSCIFLPGGYLAVTGCAARAHFCNPSSGGARQAARHHRRRRRVERKGPGVGARGRLVPGRGPHRAQPQGRHHHQARRQGRHCAAGAAPAFEGTSLPTSLAGSLALLKCANKYAHRHNIYHFFFLFLFDLSLRLVAGG